MGYGGRPMKEIDKENFEGLCGIQCTEEEVCFFFGVTEKTLAKWCKRTYGKSFSQVFREKRGVGKISLRRTQWQLAKKSPAMAIWLGKQYLDQTEKTEQQMNVSVDDGFLDALNGTAAEDWNENSDV